MFDTFSVENYRGFESLELNDLGRFNLIVGAITTGEPPRNLALFARWFSHLEAEGGTDAVIERLRQIEPRLKHLSVAVAKQESFLHADIGTGRRIPLSYSGDGFIRHFVLAMRLAAARGGVLLIDEIESSFHRTALDQVWAFLRDTARQFDVQVFATTHSWETLQSAHAAFVASPPYDFTIWRLARRDDRAEAHRFSQDAISAALATGLDLRAVFPTSPC